MAFRKTETTTSSGRFGRPGGDGGAAWRAEAARAYDAARLGRPELAGELIAAVRALTGHAPARDTIVVDPTHQAAFGAVDGVRFRWSPLGLMVVRPCDHCGRGAFSSPPIHSAEELGFALSAWQALHRDCEPFVADEFD